MILSAVFELSQSKSEMKQLMTEQSESLIETIDLSSANAIISNDEIEELIAHRLLSTARMVAYLENLTYLSQIDLERIAKENHVYRINIFNNRGEKILSNYIPDSLHKDNESKHKPSDFFETILTGVDKEIIIGLKETRYGEGKRFAVAVARKKEGGAIVVNVDASYLLEFKKRIGFGKMLQDIGTNPGIVYIVLQDEAGIIAATKNITDISSLKSDNFLLNTYNKDTLSTRIFDFNEQEVFEVVKPLTIDGEKLGLFRLGLSMDQMHALELRMVRRGITISVIIFILAIVSISIVTINQNLKFVSGEYKKIQTYTGNILHSITDGIITSDKNGRITIFNSMAVKIFNTGEEDIIGKNIFEFLGDDFYEVKNKFISKTTVESLLIKFNDRVLDVSTTYIFDKNNDIESFTIVIRDITKIIAMEEQVKLREKLSAMGELASGVAHEVRNPLNAISMVAQRYKKEFIPKENPEEYNKVTDVLLSETKRVNEIIEGFLKFSRPGKINLQRCSAGELINEIDLLYKPQFVAKGLQFNIIKSNDADILIDKELIKQALMNLLQNALDSTEKGYVELKFSSQNDKIMFTVEDTGEGISKQDIEKIFNLYFTTKVKGTGIGLSIVQQIISQHKGFITVESEIDKGSKFKIEISA